MRVIACCLVAAALFAPVAQAQSLAPGHPAGVRQAARTGPNMYLVATAGALAIAGGAYLMSQGGSTLATSVINGGQTPPVTVTNTVTTSSSTGTN